MNAPPILRGSGAAERGSALGEPLSPRLQHLQHVIEHSAHLLPAQGPITVFIHHNTLHAFEDLTFDEAVKKGGRVFGCHPYLTEARYREELRRGRIRFADLQEVLDEDLGERGLDTILDLCTRQELRLAMLEYSLLTAPTEELRWFVAETDALRRIRPEASSVVRGHLIAETRRWVMRDLRGGNEGSNGSGVRRPHRPPENLSVLFDRFGESNIENWDERIWESLTLHALWRVSCDGVSNVPPPPAPPLPLRHRDLLLEATGSDTDVLVNELLIRFCSAFLDQGVAHWPLPHREEGFYNAFCTLYRLPWGPPDLWLRRLPEELTRLQEAGFGPLESIRESLDLLGVVETEWESFLSTSFLALRGWAGMVRQVEIRGDRVGHPIPEGSLVEMLAVRLILERLALAHMAAETLGYTGPLRLLRDEARKHISNHQPASAEQRAFTVFQLAQILGWSPDILQRLSREQWMTLLREIETFSNLERRRVFHQAFERRFRRQSLDALALHAEGDLKEAKSPQFQAIFCLDEREESFRRHLEELGPQVQTFGVAGFFSVPMYYRGAADAHFTPLCPIVIQPQHWVCEQVVESLEETHQRRVRTRKALGTASHQFHAGSRTFALGALLAGGLGVLASIPLVARIVFPRLTARIRQMFGAVVQTPPQTRLQLERCDHAPGTTNGNVGFTLEEMTNIAERTLRDMGLTSGFSRLVLFIGHGSNSLNNPHNSAYNCGACGGAAGGPNARAMAEILNDARVRERLAGRGLHIPSTTIFVGGYHNTCNDSVIFYDLYGVPDSHREELDAARRLIESTCDRNAHERCRRFMSAPLTMSFAAAREHVEERSEDLAQTRPECGHATNALCIVGRRKWTRGLFLDRRAFLTSYDPHQDDAEGTILARILSAVFPVCAGINLEYYFSYVDSTGWGCGTKLPHNITSLLGVMDGAASDLRTGLPWQMVEIHEPVRLLMIIETTPQLMLRIMDRNPGIGTLCRNAWVQLAVQDPETGAIQMFHNGVFQPYEPQAERLPQAASSVDWYRGWRDHLEFAEIGMW